MGQDLAAQLRTIAEHAKALRDAGVVTVKLGDVEFTLGATAEQMAPTQAQTESPPSTLSDPATYGYAEGSTLPGFRDPRGKP